LVESGPASAKRSSVKSFGKQYRLRGRTNFIKALSSEDGSKRLRGKYCSLNYLKEETSQTCFGIKVSRESGNAARRNRIKRIIREYLRNHKTDWPENMMIVIRILSPIENETGLIGEIEDMLRSIK
jgi:ribonuclease P protein component